ncbi:MAG: methyltransferase domain-containing protein [bacterium]
MECTEEYKYQLQFRNWTTCIDRLNINKKDTILDLGCSIGHVTRLLADKAGQVIGIDNNPELLKEARTNSKADNINYLQMDLKSGNYGTLPPADGIWSSYVAAYFPDLGNILLKWKGLLKPGGWIALTEMNDLFGHEWLQSATRQLFRKYYTLSKRLNLYDFEMGNKLKDHLTDCGFRIVHEENLSDPELTFQGPAKPEVLKSWEHRFDRMHEFRKYAGDPTFKAIKQEFLDSLADENHQSNTRVAFVIGRK